jgi:hypothetical protein
VEPTDFTFKNTSDMSSDHGTKVSCAKPDIVLMHKEDQGSFLNHRRYVKKAAKEGSVAKGSGKADVGRLARGDYIYVAHMGLVQLSVEVKRSPDDDYFTDPAGLKTTTPLPLYSDDSDDDDREGDWGNGYDDDDDDDDEEEDEDDGGEEEDEDGEDEDEDEEDDVSEEDDESEEDGGGGEDDDGYLWYHSYRFTVDPTLGTHDPEVMALGQAATYAGLLLDRQFRSCVFSLSVSGNFVRFLRWDREGVIVSQAVDYKTDPMSLATFLWALASASDSERGWDTSAQPSHDPKDEELFRDRVTKHVLYQLNMRRNDPRLADKVNEHYQEQVVIKLLVPSVEHEGEVQVLVSRPCFTSHSPTGRSTRGYWGVVVGESVQESEVVFVKDVWRSNVEGVEREGDILHRLHEKGVRNIPPLVAHGDVEDDGESSCELSISSLTEIDIGMTQVTDTDKVARKRWVASLTTKQCRKLVSRTHYRLVTRKAGYSLQTFAGSRELLGGAYGAYLGGGSVSLCRFSLITSIHSCDRRTRQG